MKTDPRVITLAHPPCCAICGARLAGTDPRVTTCDACARRIAVAIVRWLDQHRAAYAAQGMAA